MSSVAGPRVSHRWTGGAPQQQCCSAAGLPVQLFTLLFSSQGGSFDVADRMFHSVKGAWESASRENMSDVRELTPEFFFLPEFLTNCNAVEFGEWKPGRWWPLPHSSGLCHHLC